MSSELKKEEVRALFVLGLLAVLVTMRIQVKEMNLTVDNTQLNIFPFLDITLATWSLYAFFMVIGWSEDIVGKGFAESFRETAKAMLYASYVLQTFLLVVFGFIIYPTGMPWALSLLVLVVVGGLLTKMRKPTAPSRAGVKKYFKKNSGLIARFVILISFAFTLLSKNLLVIIPSFAVGVIIILIYDSRNFMKTHDKKQENPK